MIVHDSRKQKMHFFEKILRNGWKSYSSFASVTGLLLSQQTVAQPSSPVQAATPSAKTECREMNAMTGAVSIPIRMCRDQGGVWHRVEAPLGSASSSFSGSVQYSGSYSGTTARQAAQRQSLSLDLNRLLRDAANSAASAQSVTGTFAVDMSITGQSVRGRFELGGQQLNGYSDMTGSVRGGRCELVDETGKIAFSGTCSARGLSGTLRSDRRSGWHTEIAINARATNKQDLAQIRLAQEAERLRNAERQAEEMRFKQKYLEEKLLLARAGNVDAMLSLADLYIGDDWVPADPQKSIFWLEKAAALNSALAQYNLGVTLLNGEGVEASPARAAALFQRCAQGRSKIANSCAYNMGVMYFNGEGFPRNKQLALRWYRLCAARGYDKCIDRVNEMTGR